MTSARTVPAYPRFRRHLRVETTADQVFCVDERGVTALRGTRVAALARLLDGTRDEESLLAAGPAGMTPDEVRALLHELVAAGLVVTPPGPAAPAGDAAALRRVAEEAWWEGCGTEPPPAADAVAVVDVRGVGADPGPVTAALAAAGVVAAGPQGPPAALTVVVCGDYLDPGLAAVDAEHRAAGRPWLLACTSGARLWLGPVFRPGPSACWHCLAHRLAAHRKPVELVRTLLGRTGPLCANPAALRPGAAAVADLVALEAVKWLGGHRHDGQDAVWVWDTYTLRGEHHPLGRRPQCGTCGDPGLVADRISAPVELRAPGPGPGPVRDPEATLDRHRHLVSPVTGIVKALAPDPAAAPGLHAWLSGPTVPPGVADLAALRRSTAGQCGGKGLTASAAKAAALCEALERFSGTWHGDEPRVRGSLEGLGEAAVDPRGWMLFDPRQFPGREAWNARHSPSNHVAAPFDPAAEHDWTPLWSLTGGRRRLLPSATLFYGAPGDGSLFAESNGCAAGADLTDAVLHGLLELVERDAVGLWWYNRSRVPGVDLAAFADPRIAEQVERHDRAGRALHVLDVSADLGVPVMVAVSRLRRPEPGGGERILTGYGAAPDPAEAVGRALAEVNQALPGAAVPVEAITDPDRAAWARAGVAGRPWLLPDPDRPARRPGDHPPAPRDAAATLAGLVGTLAAQDLEVLVLDQTRPDVGLPVARVVVPGLRPFWARFAPGRLFDVPVRLGRRATPVPYDELNPEPMFP